MLSYRFTFTTLMNTSAPNRALRLHGFTLVEIMIVVSIIGLLASIAIPNFVKARDTARTNTCIANLRQIDSAKQQWALETRQASTATPTSTDLIGVTQYIKNSPTCPIDTAKTFATSYTIGGVSANPSCQIDSTNHTL